MRLAVLFFLLFLPLLAAGSGLAQVWPSAAPMQVTCHSENQGQAHHATTKHGAGGQGSLMAPKAAAHSVQGSLCPHAGGCASLMHCCVPLPGVEPQLAVTRLVGRVAVLMPASKLHGHTLNDIFEPPRTSAV